MIQNVSDGTYAIVRYAKAMGGSGGLKCSTIEILKTSEEVAIMLKQDQIGAVNNSPNQAKGSGKGVSTAKGSVRVLYNITLHTLNGSSEFFTLLDSLPYLGGDETYGPNIR